MNSAAPMQQAKTDPLAKTAEHTALLTTQNQQISTNELADLRPQVTTQRQLQGAANHSPQSRQFKTSQQMAQQSARATQLKTMSFMMNAPSLQKVEDEETLQAKSADSTVQRETAASAAKAPKQNNTGLPDKLKSGIESLSGMSMDHVKVHYNSSQPAQLNAHAYAQGSEIHVAPGQEQHVPHEAWHVVQQAQGRVQPNIQMKLRVPVNDDIALEAEADLMGAQASQMQAPQNLGDQYDQQPQQLKIASLSHSSQCVLQPVWIDYNLGNILMWDRKQQGMRWYYIVKEKRMYYQIESPDDLKRALGIPLESEEQSPAMARFQKLAGMENSLEREEWMDTRLFGHEEHEPDPAPVVKIEAISKQITRELQTQPFEPLLSAYSRVDPSSSLSASVEQTPLFDIIYGTAKSLDLSVWELELRLGSPAGYFNSFKADKANAGKSSGLNFGNLEVGNIPSFVEYVDYLIKGKKLTGSCGQTSAWIHRITGGLLGKEGGQETPLPVRDFLGVLNAHKSQPFYMRVLTGGHSFIIENSGAAMAIYQSWHGSAPMAFMLEHGLNLMSSGEMRARLEEVLLPKDSMIEGNKHRDESSAALFFGQDHKDPTPLVWFNLNLNPLSPKEIQSNIVESLTKYHAQWDYALKGGDMDAMKIPEKADRLGRESPPKDMSQILGEKGLSSDLHKGLNYLHTEQIELRDDPEAFKPAVIEAPKADPVYVFKSMQHNIQVLSSFKISPVDFEGGATNPEALARPVIMGKLIPQNYEHKATGRTYRLTKTGEGMNTTYTFTLI